MGGYCRLPGPFLPTPPPAAHLRGLLHFGLSPYPPPAQPSAHAEPIEALFESIQVFNSRSETRLALTMNSLDNRLLLFGTAIAQLIHIGAIYTPGLNTLLAIQPVSPLHWLQLLGVALGLLLVMELYKGWLRF